MDSSFWFDAINLGWSTVHTKVSHIFQIKLFFSLSEDQFCLANRVEPNEMPHYAEFYLGLLCQCTHLGITSI